MSTASRASWRSAAGPCSSTCPRAISGPSPASIQTVVDGVRDYHDFAESLGPLRTVRTDAAAAYAAGRDLAPLASEGDRVLLGGTQTGSGGGDEQMLLADGSPIENARIGEADNAAFGLALAGPAGTPVVFAEGVHGYGESRGLGALPGRWKVALFGLGVAAIVFAWARARRLGPPDRPTRTLPPARSGLRRRDGEHARTHRPTPSPRSHHSVRGRANGSNNTPGSPSTRNARRSKPRRGRWGSRTTRSWHCGVRRQATDDVLALGRVVARVTDERTLR